VSSCSVVQCAPSCEVLRVAHRASSRRWRRRAHARSHGDRGAQLVRVGVGACVVCQHLSSLGMPCGALTDNAFACNTAPCPLVLDTYELWCVTFECAMCHACCVCRTLVSNTSLDSFDWCVQSCCCCR
jgi:hypothetical protein